MKQEEGVFDFQEKMGIGKSRISNEKHQVKPLNCQLAIEDMKRLEEIENKLKDCAVQHDNAVEQLSKIHPDPDPSLVEAVVYEFDGLKSDPTLFLQALAPLFQNLQEKEFLVCKNYCRNHNGNCYLTAEVTASIEWRTTEKEIRDVMLTDGPQSSSLGGSKKESYSRNVVVFQVKSL